MTKEESYYQGVINQDFVYFT